MSRGADRHCRRPGCPCTHGAGCYRGWIDLETDNLTTPCPTCKPELADRLSKVPDPGLRDEGDLAKLAGRGGAWK